MEKIQSLAYELHDLLLNSKEFIYLKECEVKMISDVQCKTLIDNYHNLQGRYNFEKTEEVLTMLSKAKLLMDQHPLVIEYKKAFKEYQILVGNITDIVFEGFKKDTLVDKIIRAK